MLNDISQMLARPIVWLAFLIFIALFAVQGVYLATMIRSGGAAANALRIGILSSGVAVASFLARAILRFVLARALGSSDGGAGEPATGRFILYTLGYEFAFGLITAIMPILLIRLTPAPQIFILAQNGARIVLSLLLFTVAVRLIALAHSGNAIRHREIRDALGARWYVMLAAMLVGLTLMQFPVQTLALVTPMGAPIIGAVVSGTMQVFLILYVIAAYRHVSRVQGGDASVFD